MASSVSSERVFSSAGITICKQRNCLDGDIVEVLQCLKSFIHEDIMVRDLNTVAEEEVELDHVDKRYANCQDLAGSWYAQRECGAVNARVPCFCVSVVQRRA